MKQKTKLILALDVESKQKAGYFLNKLYPQIKIFKVGFQLFTAAGPEVIRLVQKKGGEVFLDLKLLDIPNTVASAVRQAVGLKVKMLTLHILGGEEMLKQAVIAAQTESRRLNVRKPLLIGITVLTSKEAKSQEVLKLAKTGIACGLDGVVCSVRELPFLKKKIKKQFLSVTPGIRLDRASGDDQKRTATIEEALRSGSDYMVVGRPILKARDPLLVAKEILAQIKKSRD